MGARVEQPAPGRQDITAENTNNGKIVMECYIRSEPTRRGFRKRMLNEWREIGSFEATEQQLAGQARCIKNRGWLSYVEIEEIRRVQGEENVRDNSSRTEIASDDYRTSIMLDSQEQQNVTSDETAKLENDWEVDNSSMKSD